MLRGTGSTYTETPAYIYSSYTRYKLGRYLVAGMICTAYQIPGISYWYLVLLCTGNYYRSILSGTWYITTTRVKAALTLNTPGRYIQYLTKTGKIQNKRPLSEQKCDKRLGITVNAPPHHLCA